jgi:hypothetical protein
MATLSRGRTCLARGKAYEQYIAANCLALYRHIDSSEPLVCQNECTAGAKHGCDIILHAHEQTYGLEIKNDRATECGQRSLIVDRTRLTLPRDDQNIVHRRYLGSHIPFDGRIPSFMIAPRATDAKTIWGRESSVFRDEIIAIESTTAIAEYYSSMGSDYIQIAGKGFYRTSADDPLNTVAPLLECGAHIRIRCKRHGSRGCLPRSVQVCFVLERKKLVDSPIDLDYPECIPQSFIKLSA